MPTTEPPAAHDLPFTRELRSALLAGCGGAGASLFALIDGARVPKLWVILRELGVEHAPLFRESPKENIIHVTPFLVRVDPGDVVPLWLSVQESALEAALFLVARLPLRDLRRHFRRFLLVLDAARKPVYLRYYDPSALAPFLASSIPIERRRFFGEVQKFFVWDREASAAARKIVFRSWVLSEEEAALRLPPPPDAHQPFRLRPGHEAVFSQAAMESYDQRTAAYLRQKHPGRLGQATAEDVLAIVNRAKTLAPELGLTSGRDTTRTAEILVFGLTEEHRQRILSRPPRDRSDELMRLRDQLVQGL